MPTFDSPLNIQHVQYTPIDYMPMANLAFSEAAEATRNIATVRSRYEDLLGMDLSTNKSKEKLSGFMKDKEQELQKYAGMNMMAYDNAKKALDLFKPLSDPNGEYSFIMGDHAYTQAHNSLMNELEQSKTKDKGAGYNASIEEISRAQMNMFTKNNDPSQWKYYMANMESYVPYKDVGKKLTDLIGQFDKLVGEGYKTKTPLNNGYALIHQDNSINQDELKSYIEQNLTAEELNQLRLDKKAEYWRGLNIYSSTDDPNKKAQVLNALKSNLVNEYKQSIDEQLISAKESLDKLQTYQAATQPSDVDNLALINKKIEEKKELIKMLSDRKLSDNELDPLFDPNNWAAAQEKYADFYVDRQLTKLARAASQKRGVDEYVNDETYFNVRNLALRQAEYQLSYAKYLLDVDKHNWDKLKDLTGIGSKKESTGNGGGNGEEPNVPGRVAAGKITGVPAGSPEEAGKQMYNYDIGNIGSNPKTFSILEQVTGSNITESLNATPNLANMTINEALNSRKINVTRELIDMIKAVRVSENGKQRTLNANKDKFGAALNYMKAMTLDENWLNYLTKSSLNNPRLSNNLSIAKTNISLINSKVEAQQDLVFETLKEALSGIYSKGVDASGKKIALINKVPSSLKSSLLTPEGLNMVLHKLGTLADGYDADDLADKFFAMYRQKANPNRYASSVLIKDKNSLLPSTNDVNKKNFEAEVARFAASATDNKPIGDLIYNFYDLVGQTTSSENGFSAQFQKSASSEKAKDFIASFNNLAENKKYGFKAVSPDDVNGSYLTAVNQLNDWLNKNYIQSTAISTNDFKIDPNTSVLINGVKLKGLDVTQKELAVYGIINAKPISLSLVNYNAGKGMNDYRIGFSGNYFQPDIDVNGQIQRDANGNVKLKAFSDVDINETYINKLSTKYPLASRQQLQDALNKMMAANPSEYITQQSNRARNFLTLIAYLNANPNIKTLTNELIDKYIQNN